MAVYYSIVRVFHTLCIHLLVDGHLGCCLFWAAMNNATMNILVYIFMLTYVFYSLEYMPGNCRVIW